MALPSSGALHAANISSELSRAGTQVSLDDFDVRTLAGKLAANSTISMEDFRGKTAGASIIQVVPTNGREAFGKHVSILSDSMLVSSMGALHMYEKVGLEWVFRRDLVMPDGYEIGAHAPTLVTNQDASFIGLGGRVIGSNTYQTFLFEKTGPAEYSFVQTINLLAPMAFSPDGSHFFGQSPNHADSRFVVLVRNYDTWAPAHTSYPFATTRSYVRSCLATPGRLTVIDQNLGSDSVWVKIGFLVGNQAAWSNQDGGVSYSGRTGWYMHACGTATLSIGLGRDKSRFPYENSNLAPYYTFVPGVQGATGYTTTIKTSPVGNPNWLPSVGAGAVSKYKAVVPTQRRADLVGSSIENVIYIQHSSRSTPDVIPTPNNAAVRSVGITPDSSHIALATTDALYILA